MKATSIFGGVQVFQIIIGIIRSKFVAILLGPTGMGIAGLLSTTIGLISGLTHFGLGISAVKNIAEANKTGNELRISIVASVLRRLVWITGTLGTILTLSLSSWLSQVTFGNQDFTFAFLWLSITLLFSQLSNGQLVILQGMRKLQYLAKANLAGSALGLIITVPIYYKFGLDGIVPGMIITSIGSLTLSWYYSKKIHLQTVKVTLERTVVEGKSMLMMGFMISLSSIIGMGSSYILRIFIATNGSIEQVGLYNAGFAILNTYVGLIFTAMGTDYYPRLSGVAHNNVLSNQTINQQSEIALLILSPILIFFIVFIKWVVILLYSVKFIEINPMIYWASLGIFFKASSWAIAFVFLAKGENRLFFWNELITNIYLLVFNLLGYYYLGLTGLGLSFLAAYFIYYIQVFLIAKIKFGFLYDKGFSKIFIIQFGLAILSLISIKYLSASYSYYVGAGLILFSSIYSYKELDKRIDISSLVATLTNRFRN